MSKKFIRRGDGLKKLTKRLNDGYVTVGIHRKEGKHKDSDLTVAAIGAIHEYGARGMPERSFMRSTLFEQRRKISSALFRVAKGNFKKKRTQNGIKKIGEYLRGKIQAKIVALRTPPNALSTIQRKGSSNPLIDTGQLLQSIHSVYHAKRPK